jgi:hypothetical protein
VRAANRQLGLGVPVTHFEAIAGLLVESQTQVAQYFDELCPPADEATSAAAAGHAPKEKETE